MRCKHLVERNGYFTGKRCSREATCIVTIDNAEVGEAMCTQHAKQTQAKHWQRPERCVVEKIAP